MRLLERFDQRTVLEEAQLERFEPDAVGFVGGLEGSGVEESAGFVLGNFEVAH